MVLRVPLETARLRLEPVSGGHAAALHQAVIDSRPELLQWMPWARAPNLEGGRDAAARGEAAWRDGREFHFVVVERSTDEVLGVAGLNREGESAAELHYWIRSGHTGLGFATEAGRALIKWAPGELGVSRLTLWAGRENRASRRVAEKLGFVHVGPLGWRPQGGLGQFDAESYELHLISARGSGHEHGGDAKASSPPMMRRKETRMTQWTTDQLDQFGRAEEVQIARVGLDGKLRQPVTVWVVRRGDDLYLRSVSGRSGHWFRGTQERHEGRILAGGVQQDVTFVDADPAIEDEVDAAYRTKYRRYAGSILNSVLTREARAATLKLVPRPTGS